MSFEGDSKDLGRFGYRQELKRSLGSFSSFAAGFSYISILTGVFQTFYLGYGAGGPAFFWSWPVVFCGQFLVALCFAELASHYPLSGGVYQWAKHIGGNGWGILTGWVYVACLIVTLAAVPLALQASLPLIDPIFQVTETASMNGVVLGAILIVLSTAISSFGVKLMARINDIGVLTEIVGIVVLIGLLAYYSVRSPSEFLFDTGVKGSSSYLFPFLSAMGLTASYVLYGYDTAGTLAEETLDPRRRAPRAILQALSAAGIAGLLVLLLALMAAPDLKALSLSKIEGGLPLLVHQVLGEKVGKFFLCDVVFAVCVCTLAVQAGAARLLYAMARDGYLPKSFGHISPRFRTPAFSTVFVGLLAVLILWVNAGFPRIFEMVTGVAMLWANLGYLLVVAVLLKKRLQGWPREKSEFSLGRWGFPINAAALCWCLFTVTNISWPRVEIYGSDPLHRYGALWLTTILLVTGFIFQWLLVSKKLKWNRLERRIPQN